MERRRKRIAELYYLSNSVQFVEHEMSVHQEDPTAPLTPYYLHYPKPDEPGSAFLPELYSLIGEEFFTICEAQNPPIRPARLAGVPDGATPLAAEHASHYRTDKKNVLTFMKLGKNGPSVFMGPDGEFNIGDELLIDDDHTSGGRNKRLVRAAAVSAGLVVPRMLTVVDRQQGAVENMRRDGVEFLSIFTAAELLDYGASHFGVSREQIAEIEEYTVKNQYKLTQLQDA